MDLKPYRAKRGVNVTSPKGGAWSVPISEYLDFLEQHFLTCEVDCVCVAPCDCVEREPSYLCEVAQPVGRLFFDIDTDRAWPGLKRNIEAAVNELFAPGPDGDWRVSMAWRDGSHNMHLVFPGLIVTKATLRAVVALFRDELCADIDPAASGLRLPGSLSADGGPAYFPLCEDMSIQRQELEDLATIVVSPRVGRPQSLKALLPRINGTLRKGLHKTPAKAQLEIVHIRTLRKEWRRLDVDKATEVHGLGKFITVKGPGKTYCQLVGRCHTKNRINFWIDNHGVYRQKCFKCSGNYAFRGPFLA